VYATIKHSPYAAQYESELEDLANWAADILENAFDELRSTNLLPNVFGVDPSSTFSDAGASATRGPHDLARPTTQEAAAPG